MLSLLVKWQVEIRIVDFEMVSNFGLESVDGVSVSKSGSPWSARPSIFLFPLMSAPDVRTDVYQLGNAMLDCGNKQAPALQWLCTKNPYMPSYKDSLFLIALSSCNNAIWSK